MDFKTRIYAEVVIALLVGLVALAVAFWLGGRALNRNEVMECKQWQKDSQTYPGWYATSWQIDQCKHHGLPLKK